MRRVIRRMGKALAVVLLIVGLAHAADLKYKDRLLESLVKKVPGILESFDPDSGRFGSGIWTCRDQHPMYPLAVVYTTAADDNPYYDDPEILKVIRALHK